MLDKNLAAEIGLTEAIILQFIYSCIREGDKEAEGRKWASMTYNEIQSCRSGQSAQLKEPFVHLRKMPQISSNTMSSNSTGLNGMQNLRNLIPQEGLTLNLQLSKLAPLMNPYRKMVKN
ncbi:hypothetical protein [Cytobacillus firmus]|uniref:hypothetical protein n=1 Tax=Cytobacillus firmus TaxID=1399 RepID=UPI00222852E5|nr:hypothetical protein [Cytobacillus firmus]